MENMIKHEQIPHIINRQNALEKAFLAKLEAGNYTIQNPLVILDPYEVAPLTAMILFNTPVASEATIVVKGKEHPGDIRHTFPSTEKHILPIYGLYADYENTVEIIMSNSERNSVTIKTEPLLPEVPVATSIRTTSEYMGNNMMFLTASFRSLPAGYDYAGDIRWFSPKNFAFDLKRMPNGHILIGTERLVKMPYFATGLYEMAFSGKIFKEYTLPSGYHHDQMVMDDGNILVLTQDFYSGTVEDVCVLMDSKSGEILKKWDFKTVLPQNVAGSGSQDTHDWFHNNAVWYDKKTNSLTLSGRHQDAVINLNFETGELNWVIGDPEGWPQDMVEKYFFTPVGNGEFDWQYEQHGCVVLPDGDIMLFDNGHFRSKNKEKYSLNKDNFSRGVRYRIDTEKMTIEQVWQYGKERGAEFFSPYICNVEYYNEGHYMVHSGGIGYENGEACEGMAVMKAMQPKFKDNDYTFNSITCELQNDQLVYELQVPANCYRAEKLPIYYANEIAELGDGLKLGQLIQTQTTKMKVKAVESGDLVPDHYEAKIIEEEDRFNFNAIFESGEMAQLLLEDETGEILRYPINTVAQNFQAMCVGTFQKADLRNVDTFINKTGLLGKYEVKLVAEEKIYKTGVTIKA
ncbi:aryl-sulfate sulfotransferase [Desulfosporosinus shakirovi]|uniref:aryl-sulfate sulfotransferase n=1 Tax=Desulfosporosinus shakirovi TaxID=2885154 RepID=UPI001E340EAE|nr:aryl-sulfate sulfotransferase [Desulfosporosinus sp. SRJS8]MCB8817842.1 aryl-sulfate sulfotransferase [Desulfosporosinus sp. SRJS8]